MFAGFALAMLKSKLRRICCNKKLNPGYRTWKIEQALKKSKLPVLESLLHNDPDCVDDALTLLLAPDTCTMCVSMGDSEFEEILRASLEQIRGYSQLMTSVENLRKIPYSSDNKHHEDMLLQLWERLCPHKPLRSRVTRQWTEIGFQGRNPVTDFRGMGFLGLQNLLFCVTHYTEAAHEILQHSKHRDYGYSFAIVGINMTSLAYNLLFQGYLKPYFYNISRGPPQLQHFNNFYCYLLQEFDRFWMSEKPRDLMQFTLVKSKFETRMLQKLRSKDLLLVNPFIMDNSRKSALFLDQSSPAKRTSAFGTDICNTSFHLWI